jgi:hypothetical protein
MTLAELNAALKAGRLAAYAEARGGWPVPLAGAAYWGALAWLGLRMDPANWSLLAAVMSGAIFPVAVALAAIFRNPFMKVTVPDQGVVFMAMGAMLLFWPVAIAAMWNFNALTPLILAIGMSGHWPVFGWSYGRPLPFLAHAIVRAMVCFSIWEYMPDGRFTVLPAAVAAIYVVTVAVLFIDSGAVARRLRADKA